MASTANQKTSPLRKELKKSVAELSAKQPGPGRLVADLLDPHFIAEDRLIAAERALAVADGEVRKAHALCVHAAEQSQTTTAGHQAKWLAAFERLEWEERDAQVALKRARLERDEASMAYYRASGELRDVVAYL